MWREGSKSAFTTPRGNNLCTELLLCHWGRKCKEKRRQEERSAAVKGCQVQGLTMWAATGSNVPHRGSVIKGNGLGFILSN